MCLYLRFVGSVKFDSLWNEFSKSSGSSRNLALLLLFDLSFGLFFEFVKIGLLGIFEGEERDCWDLWFHEGDFDVPEEP